MILIRNAQIVDGTGKPPYRADVLISGERISAIGDFPRHPAEEVIEAGGAYLTPGFVDVNTDSDHYLTLFTDPEQEDFLLQGVTTIIGGQCGSSLAPLLYGSLESIRKWADPNQINVDWHTVAEFFKLLERRGLGVNFGTLVGHSTVRRALIGETSRDLTVNELRVFKEILERALKEGALGLSTGLEYAHSRGTPYQELKELASAVRKAGGIYATHLRDQKEGILTSVKEVVKLTRETKVKVIISHLHPFAGFEDEFTKSLRLVEKFGGSNIYFDNFPFDASLVPIYTLLPDWAKHGSLEKMLEVLGSAENEERIINELPEMEGNDIRIAEAPAAEYLIGKSLREFCRNRGFRLLKKGLLELMKITRLRAIVLYRNINLDMTLQSLLHKRALVASNAMSAGKEGRLLRHERITDTFSRFLRIAFETKLISLEKAVEKITRLPAKLFNLTDRGEIAPEKIADLVLIRDGLVSHVLVNGRLVVKDGVALQILAGQIIRSNH